ncbi:unnamed protein product [Gemmata massiliana]|uniref:Uncharacterized protein n=1 Tax=Gemmata massiliana TaxID=1210884 RepID=A0A6P2DA66_9BACT|nr:hypothetical protein [Gemmata massiliana]VTR98069.1 unnamed protein product [Gemmata massiliana]
MTRKLLVAAVAALVLVAPVEAKRILRNFTATEKLVRADAVVIGKVSAIEKELVSATPVPGAPDKLSYKIGVIKIETGLAGTANVTHIKVGFLPPAPVAPAPAGAPPGRPIRGGLPPINLTEGQEGLFYLTKHHSGDFYTISPMMPPTDAKAEDYKAQIEQVKKGLAVLADPVKALKSEKADDRAFAAHVLVNKYRAYPEGGGEVEDAKVPAEESQLVLKAIAAGNWKPDPNAKDAINFYQAFGMLGLNDDQDGWKYPMAKPGEDFTDKTKEAFVKWLDGPGKSYQINKFVKKK